MTPHVVVDIGNTRIKWGAVASGGVARVTSLPDDPEAWRAEREAWRRAGLLPDGPAAWVLASVQPARCDRLRGWLEERGDRVVQLSRAAQLPLRVGLAEPDRAGIDRLLDAVAAARHLPAGRAAVLIDAGSAVTIDYLDEEHVFQGGLIAPGLDLMAKALNSYTALLPRIEITLPVPELPAGATIPAMQVGIFLSVAGCIREAVRQYAAKTERPPVVFFTGGQAPVLAAGMGLPVPPPHPQPLSPEAGEGGERRPPRPRLLSPEAGEGGGRKAPPDVETRGEWVLWPEQTLMGILYSAEAQP